MPVTPSKLRHVMKSKHPYIERNLGSVVSIIRHSMQNAAAFEPVAKKLKEEYIEIVRFLDFFFIIFIKFRSFPNPFWV